jgi:hypothetical protein
MTILTSVPCRTNHENPVNRPTTFRGFWVANGKPVREEDPKGSSANKDKIHALRPYQVSIVLGYLPVNHGILSAFEGLRLDRGSHDMIC